MGAKQRAQMNGAATTRLNLEVIKNTDTGEVRVMLSMGMEQALEIAEDLKHAGRTPGSHAFLQALRLVEPDEAQA